MKRIVHILLCLLPAYMQCQNKSICITVDDLPTVTYGQAHQKLSLDITNKLNATFTKFNIPAIGYVVESGLYAKGQVDPIKVDLLRIWIENGKELGNHTFSHLDFNNVSDSVYFDNILKGEVITRKLMQEHGKTLKYFRHPYLHTGMEKSRTDSLNKFLKNSHYIIAPVTIDNDDYLFAKAYNLAFNQNKDSLMMRIGNNYIDYMEKKLIYFEQKSQDVFGRNITQTLLIHASLLNADYLDELAVMFLKHGYKFVSQQEALKDGAYQSEDTFYTKYGISWIYRWGLSKGMNKKLMDGDIEAPEYIIKMVNEN